MKKYGIIVVGCGWMAREYLSMLNELENMNVIGVVDRKPDRAREYAEEYGVPSHGTDYNTFLNKDDVDIVVVTTRPSSHARIAIESMRAGKHVFSEKPMCSSLEDAQEMLDVARVTGSKIHIGFILRSNKSCQKVNRMIREGAIGFPVLIKMFGGEHTVDEDSKEWNYRLLRDTSPVIDCGSHYVDLMRDAIGREAVSVCGTGLNMDDHIPEDNYNFGALNIKFEDGSIGLYEVGWGETFREFWYKEYIGPKGRLRLTFANERPENREEGDLIELYQFPGQYNIINLKCRWLEFDTEFLKLIKLIEEDADPVPGLLDAARSLEIVLAGHKAILENEVQKNFGGIIR